MRRLAATVVGCGGASKRWSPEVEDMAMRVGAHLARNGFVVVTGGRDGTMRAAAFGAQSEEGLVVGILPSDQFGAANDATDIVLPTNLGIGRNVLTALAGDFMVALPGGTGTLEEMAYALDYGRPVVSWDSWRCLPGVPVFERGEWHQVARWIEEQRVLLVRRTT